MGGKKKNAKAAHSTKHYGRIASLKFRSREKRHEQSFLLTGSQINRREPVGPQSAQQPFCVTVSAAFVRDKHAVTDDIIISARHFVSADVIFPFARALGSFHRSVSILKRDKYYNDGERTRFVLLYPAVFDW